MYTLRIVLSQKNYSNKDMKSATKERHPKLHESADPPVGHAILPYVKGITDKIGTLLHRHNILTIYKPIMKIAAVLPGPKNKINL